MILIDSSENDEEDVIEYSEIIRDVSASQPQAASSHEIELTDNATSEHDTDQSNCSSDERGDEECVDSNVEEDMNTQVNLFVFLNSDCTCKDCTDLNISHQLGDIDKSKVVHSHNSKERQDCKKSYCRKIQPAWYQKYPWITVCSSRYKIFCRTCRSAQQQGLLSSSVLSRKSDMYQNMLCKVNKVILLYFTFPVTTATAERSFSDLRRMKAFLCSTMSPCRLNNLFNFCYIYTNKKLISWT